MQSTTSIKTTTKDGKPMSVRLGDVFVMKSRFAAIKSDVDISNYIILSLLTVAITPASPHMPPSRIYFSMIGIDSLRYSISRRTENGLIILDHGKEIELDEKYMLRAAKALSGSKASGIVGGLELYMRTIITSPSKMGMMDMRKLPTRLVDLSKWPRMSLRQWAMYHLGLGHVPTVNYIDNRTNMINSMIKLSVSARRTDNPNGMVRGMSVHGVTTGRIPHNYSRLNGDRFGKVRGVPFINLNPNEMKFPQGHGDCIEVRPYSDVSRNDINPYMIVCVGNRPEWVLLSGDIRPQGHITWTFYDGYRLNMPIKAFDNDLLEWLMVAHDGRDAINEGVEEVAVKHKADLCSYNSPDSNYISNYIENNGSEILYATVPGPVVSISDIPVPVVKNINAECLWSDDGVTLEDHKIKSAYKYGKQVYGYGKIEDSEEEEEEV